MGIRVDEETLKPVRDNRKVNVEVDTGNNKIARASVKGYHRTVPVAQVRYLLGFVGPRRVNRSPGIGEVGREDIISAGPGKVVPYHVGFLKKTQGIRGVIEGGE